MGMTALFDSADAPGACKGEMLFCADVQSMVSGRYHVAGSGAGKRGERTACEGILRGEKRGHGSEVNDRDMFGADGLCALFDLRDLVIVHAGDVRRVGRDGEPGIHGVLQAVPLLLQR